MNSDKSLFIHQSNNDLSSSATDFLQGNFSRGDLSRCHQRYEEETGATVVNFYSILISVFICYISMYYGSIIENDKHCVSISP